MASSEVMTSSTHSFAYSYRLVKKCFVKNCETSKCHNFLIFQPIFIRFSLLCLEIFTLSSEIKLNLLWSSSLKDVGISLFSFCSSIIVNSRLLVMNQLPSYLDWSKHSPTILTSSPCPFLLDKDVEVDFFENIRHIQVSLFIYLQCSSVSFSELNTVIELGDPAFNDQASKYYTNTPAQKE